MDTVKKKTKSGADVYEDMHSSVQSFNGIGLLEAVNGNIVLRGRNGQRDVIFTLERAVEKYHDTVATVHQYARYGIRGWDTLKDIADDFKVRICEAVEQRRKMQLEIPANAAEFAAIVSEQ
jgi:hypothetical protein